MKYPQVGALILKTRHLKECVNFYRLLEVPLEEERHDDGPLHFACELGDIHFAIYEDKETDIAIRPSLMVGFSVRNLDETISQLKQSACKLLREPEDRPWGKRAIATDPDGRHVEIWQPK